MMTMMIFQSDENWTLHFVKLNVLIINYIMTLLPIRLEWALNSVLIFYFHFEIFIF